MFTNPNFRKGGDIESFNILKGLNDNDRKRLLLDFITEHEGSNVTKIVDSFTDKGHKSIAKPIVHKLLREMDDDKLIKNISEKSNEKKYIPNKDNEFIKLDKKIKLFARKYFNFLNECKNVSDLANANQIVSPENNVGIHSKQNPDLINPLIAEYHEGEKIFERIHYQILIINQCNNELINLDKQIGTILKQEITKHTNPARYSVSTGDSGDKSQTLDPEVYSNKRIYFAKLIKESVSTLKILLSEYKGPSIQSGVLRINMWSIFVFILFLHYVNFSSIMRWPYVISDLEMIIKLNILLQESLLEINSKLYSYILSNQHTSHFITSIIKGEKFRSFMNIQDERFYQMIEDYQNFGLKDQIIGVLHMIDKDDDNLLRKKVISIDDFIEEKSKLYESILNGT